MGGDDGILDLEEVDGVEVVYEDTDAGRVVKFNVSFPTTMREDLRLTGTRFWQRKMRMH